MVMLLRPRHSRWNELRVPLFQRPKPVHPQHGGDSDAHLRPRIQWNILGSGKRKVSQHFAGMCQSGCIVVRYEHPDSTEHPPSTSQR